VSGWGQNLTFTKMWADVSSFAPHLLHNGLSSNPIRWRCLLRVLCPVRRPVTTLEDGPFVAHNLISSQDSCILYQKFQMVPRLNIPMTPGSRKRTQIYYYYNTIYYLLYTYLFSLKFSSKRTHSTFPSGAPKERDTGLRGIVHISKKKSNKVPLIRRPQERNAHSSPHPPKK